MTESPRARVGLENDENDENDEISSFQRDRVGLENNLFPARVGLSGKTESGSRALGLENKIIFFTDDDDDKTESVS